MAAPYRLAHSMTRGQAAIPEKNPPAPLILLRIKVQIFCGAEIAMGPGKAHLLEAIAAAGSISGAARAMGMSYRRAWLLVDAMNRCWQEPLVLAAPGRTASGGGAWLSPFGSEVLGWYRALEGQAGAAQHGATWASLSAGLRDVPRAR